MNSTIGIYAKAYVSVAVKYSPNSMIGMAVNVPAAVKPVMNGTIGIYAKANVTVAVKHKPNNTIGTAASVPVAVKKIMFGREIAAKIAAYQNRKSTNIWGVKKA
jgi:hypothetical protein